MELNTIEEAIEAIKNGEIIIVVDDEDRENEGDFLIAAEKVNSQVINFMATHGRGLICAPLVEDRCDELKLDMMVNQNTAAYETPFTVSIDLIGHGTTTGISASDRAKTVKALVNPNTKAEELGKPGQGKVFHYTTRFGIRSAWKTMEARSGIKTHPHKFRHTFATRVLKNSDISTLMSLGGWSSEKMALRYAKVVDTRKVDAIKKL